MWHLSTVRRIVSVGLLPGVDLPAGRLARWRAVDPKRSWRRVAVCMGHGVGKGCDGDRKQICVGTIDYTLVEA